MIALLNFIFIFGGLVLFKMITKNYSYSLNHVSLFSSIWLFVVVGAQFSELRDLSLGTISVLYLSWYSFLLGSIVNGETKNMSKKLISVLDTRKIEIICVSLVLLSVAANFDLIRSVLFNFSSFQVWAEMRKENAFAAYRSDNAFYTLFGPNAVIFIPLALYLYKSKRISRKYLMAIISIGFLLAILAFTRAPILQLMIISIVSYSFLNEHKKFPIKILLISAIILLTVFIISSFFIRNADASSSVLISDIEIYLFGGVLAYETILQGNYFQAGSFDSPYYSLDFLNYILKEVSLINSYPNLVREYDSQLVTNVYTYLDAFTLDFGVIGAFVGPFLIGYLCKSIYLSYRKKQYIIYLILYATVCYFCVFAFTNNEFIRNTLIILIIKLLVIHLIIKIKWRS